MDKEFIKQELQQINETSRAQFSNGVTWFTFFVTFNGTVMGAIVIASYQVIFDKENKEIIGSSFYDTILSLTIACSLLLIYACYLGYKFAEKTIGEFENMRERENFIIDYANINFQDGIINNTNIITYFNVSSSLYINNYLNGFKNMKKSMYILFIGWMIIILLASKLIFYPPSVDFSKDKDKVNNLEIIFIKRK